LQALTLLNDPTFTECARALADRLWDESARGEPERIRHAFRLCLARNPTPDEIRKVELYLYNQRRDGAGNPDRPARDAQPVNAQERPSRTRDEWVGLARALLNLDEFITRE
jgi:hypothetical protein